MRTNGWKTLSGCRFSSKLGTAKVLRVLPFHKEVVEWAVLFARYLILPAGIAPKPNITGLRIWK